jgi:nitroreductase
MTQSFPRTSTVPIGSFFLERTSSRAMTGELLKEEEFLSLFEAARWAPSSYNTQPWKFLYAKRDSDNWPLFFDLLVPSNQEWTIKASCLVLILSRKHSEQGHKSFRTHSFDTGAAWMSLALEGFRRGLVVHGMSGFDYDKARQTLRIPEEFEIEAMIAIGKKAPKESLPAPLQAKEIPSQRKNLEEIMQEGPFIPLQ